MGRSVEDRDEAYARMRGLVPILGDRAVTRAEARVEQQAAIDDHHDLEALVILHRRSAEAGGNGIVLP